VHLIAHTHDDVGWLKTVDQYFTGSNQGTQIAEVRYILDSVIQELLADPLKKFTYVEMKYFSMWWDLQTTEIKAQVRGLVTEGRLQFANAGWSMSDEACPNYEDMINNMFFGNTWLYAELGVRSWVGWQIDPFGHSSTMARIFAEMGFRAWFFGRLDYQDKKKRMDNQEMEFLWRPSFDELGRRAQMFTHVLYNLYIPPPGFWVDERGPDDAIVDDKSASNYNLDMMIDNFHNWVVEQKKHYKSNHILVTMGMDFYFGNAPLTFKNIDKLIYYHNMKYQDCLLFYSTPLDYTNAVNQLDITWPVKYDDMFPYADKAHAYWTGFYTSRATDKEYAYRGSAAFRAANQMIAFKIIDPAITNEELDSYKLT